jgi:hypothetical protein
MQTHRLYFELAGLETSEPTCQNYLYIITVQVLRVFQQDDATWITLDNTPSLDQRWSGSVVQHPFLRLPISQESLKVGDDMRRAGLYLPYALMEFGPTGHLANHHFQRQLLWPWMAMVSL